MFTRRRSKLSLCAVFLKRLHLTTCFSSFRKRLRFRKSFRILNNSEVILFIYVNSSAVGGGDSRAAAPNRINRSQMKKDKIKDRTYYIQYDQSDLELPARLVRSETMCTLVVLSLFILSRDGIAICSTPFFLQIFGKTRHRDAARKKHIQKKKARRRRRRQPGSSSESDKPIANEKGQNKRPNVLHTIRPV